MLRLIILALFLISATPTLAQDATCTVATNGKSLDLSSAPSPDANALGVLDATPQPVTGQIVGADGQTWWRVFVGAYVADDDAVVTTGDCAAVPTLPPPPDYCAERTEPAERPVLSGETIILDSSRFRIHYTTSGEDASTAQFAADVAAAMETSWDFQVGTLGWPAPTPDCGEGGDERFDVYLEEIESEGALGYAQSEHSAGDIVGTPAVEFDGGYSYLAIDNDFADSGRPLATLRATAAHEFHHNIQMSYDIGDAFAGLDEAGAVWMETLTFPDEQDAMDYLYDSFDFPDVCIGNEPNSDASRVYGEWVMIDSLAQDYGRDFIRQVWDFRAAEEHLAGFYSALAAVGTTPEETVARVGIRNLLRDFELERHFPVRVYVERQIVGPGEYGPRRDGVQPLSVDYLTLSTPGRYEIGVNDDTLALYLIGIVDEAASVTQLGRGGVVDTSAFQHAHLMIVNTERHDSVNFCESRDWRVTVRESDGVPLPPTAEIWNAADYEVPALFGGTATYTGTSDDIADVYTYRIVDVFAGDRLIASAEDRSGTFDSFLMLITEADSFVLDYESIVGDDDSGQNFDAYLDYTFTDAGDYAIVLTNPGVGFEGDFELTLELIKSGEPSPPSGLAQHAETAPPEGSESRLQIESGSLDDTGRSYHAIGGVRAGDTIYIYAEGVSGDMDTVLALDYDRNSPLFDIDAPFLAEDDDGGGGVNSFIEFVAPADGDYEVIVLAYEGTSGDYRVVWGVNAPEVRDYVRE